MDFITLIIKAVKKDRKIIAASVAMGIMVTAALGMFATKAYSESVQKEIAESVIRFHVLANSDGAGDQELKLSVRDRVLSEIGPMLKDKDSARAAEAAIGEALEEIKAAAEDEIKKQGYSYEANVSLGNDIFPMREYGGAVFPAGQYKSLRIEIGRGEGHNWWCVMYPPLCFLDLTFGAVSEEGVSALREALPKEGCVVVVDSRAGGDIVPEVKFKVVQWWQDIINGARLQ